MTENQIKYEVEIHAYSEPQKPNEEIKAILRESGMMTNGKINIKGVSAKMLRRMKTEYVTCPILESDLAFLKCFLCPNFQSRVRGKVLCRGNPLPEKMYKTNTPSADVPVTDTQPADTVRDTQPADGDASKTADDARKTDPPNSESPWGALPK